MPRKTMAANGNSQGVSPVSSQNSPGTPRRGPGPRRFNIETDRFCVHCSVVISFQVRDKPSNCFRCKKALRFGKTDGVVQEQDMGRCDNCDVYLHADDTFCHLCGKGAFKNVQRKRRLEAAAYRQDKFRDGVVLKEKDAKIAKLEEELAMAVKQNGEMKDDLKSQDDIRMANHPNNDFDDTPDEQELFNKAAEAAGEDQLLSGAQNETETSASEHETNLTCD